MFYNIVYRLFLIVSGDVQLKWCYESNVIGESHVYVGILH